MARDLISRIQRMRKEAGLAVSDRIVVRVAGGPEVIEAVDAHRDWIASEVLAKDIMMGDAALHEQQAVESVDLDGPIARIAITKEE
jgi:isoleucyl-tRNA synthetase